MTLWFYPPPPAPQRSVPPRIFPPFPPPDITADYLLPAQSRNLAIILNYYTPPAFIKRPTSQLASLFLDQSGIGDVLLIPVRIDPAILALYLIPQVRPQQPLKPNPILIPDIVDLSTFFTPSRRNTPTILSYFSLPTLSPVLIIQQRKSKDSTFPSPVIILI